MNMKVLYRVPHDLVRATEGRHWLPVDCFEIVLVGELMLYTYSPSTYWAPVVKVARFLRRA